MFKRILFPTDFSVFANTVTACLPSLQSAGVTEVVLLHVIRAKNVPLPETYNLESYKFIRWCVEEQLNLLRMMIEGHGLRVQTRMEYGSPISEIVRVAKDEQVGMIVIGAQGMTKEQEILIGGTAFEVVRHTSIPVLLQKAEDVHEEGHNRCRLTCAEMFKHVMFPTDFSETADEAFRIVAALKSAGTEEVILLHVQDERVMRHRTQEQLDFFDRKNREQLEERCTKLADLGFKTRWILKRGNPTQETIIVADKVKCGLIVIGSQGRSAVQELLNGRTLENVIRRAKHPVLIVRSQKQEAKKIIEDLERIMPSEII